MNIKSKAKLLLAKYNLFRHGTEVNRCVICNSELYSFLLCEKCFNEWLIRYEEYSRFISFVDRREIKYPTINDAYHFLMLSALKEKK